MMTRRDLLRALAAGAGTTGIIASGQQPAKSVLIGYREYARCLPDAIRMLAAEAYERRNVAIRKLTSAAAIRARQKWARETFWKIAGGMPERTPLNVRTTGAFDRERYRVEKLVYQSRPDEWVSANLYIPKSGPAPFPGVLFQMGHTANGKAGDTYQRCCQGLVQLGFVVLAFDPMGQGERINYPGPDGRSRLPSPDHEHTVAGMQMLLLGETATGMQTWDAVRSLDVLASHPLVDSKRLASTGQSGGATVTMLLAAVDDRLACAAVSSGNTENFACAKFHPPGSTDDAEQNLIGSAPLGFDRWDLLWPFAPKPLLILSSAKDFFGTYSPNYEDSGQEEYARLEAAYRVLQQPNHLQRFESPLPHGLSYVLRLEVYRWLTRWLEDAGRKIDQEPPVTPEPDRILWATESGSVARDLGSKTPFQSLRERARKIETPSQPADLRSLLGIRQMPGRPHLRELSRVPSRDCDILAVEIPTAAHVWAPAWIFVPKQPVRRLLIVVEPRGRNSQWAEGGLFQRLAAAGTVVCAPDLRGIGDLRPEYSPGAPDYMGEHENEENYAWASLMLGHSLMGQRVTDLVAVIEALSAGEWGAKPLLAARGQLTIPALCAASLAPEIAAVYLAGHLVSWRSLVETENYRHPFANFIPNVLRSTDLPGIAAALAPRKVTISGIVDGAGQPVPTPEARRIYPSSNIEVREEAAWDTDALLHF